jgi:DNA-binding XRE family transcriptional regulator
MLLAKVLHFKNKCNIFMVPKRNSQVVKRNFEFRFGTENKNAPAMNTPEKIRTLRLLKGLTHKEMAYHLDISREYYGRIERGKGHIDINRLKQIAAILGVQTESLLPDEKSCEIPTDEMEKRITSLPYTFFEEQTG